MDKPIKTPDHDLLITLNTKVDQLSVDVKDLKTDLMTRMVRAETRLDASDVRDAGIPMQDIIESTVWAKNFRSNIKLMMLFAGIFFGTIGALVTRILQVWFKF